MLKMKYAKKDEIPDGFATLFTENASGEWVLTEVEGVKSVDDVETVKTALRREREEHSKTKTRFKPLENLELDDVISKLDRFDELEAAAAGKIDESKIEEIVSARLQTKINPLNRELETLRATNAELTGQVETMNKAQKTSKIHAKLRDAIEKGKITDVQRADALVLGAPEFDLDEQGNVITSESSSMGAGFSPDQWVARQQTARPHWFGKTSSGGFGGGGGNQFAGQTNPWARSTWNATEQGRLIRTDRDLAEQMARAAGSFVGATNPPEK